MQFLSLIVNKHNSRYSTWFFD